MPARHKPNLIPFNALMSDRERSGGQSPAPSKRPRPPKWLAKEAAAIWRRKVREMIDAGNWHPAFADTLASYVVLEAEFQANPKEFTSARMAQKRLLAADLGLSPATFGRVQLTASRGASRNPTRTIGQPSQGEDPQLLRLQDPRRRLRGA